MSTVVTDEDVARYRDDGVVLIRNLLDERWLSVLADGIADNLRRPSPAHPGIRERPRERRVLLLGRARSR